MPEEDDRRVEPRGAVTGTGMLTDPERIEALQAESARRKRAWRDPPSKGFREVMQGATTKKFERVGVYASADERLALDEQGDGSGAAEEEADVDQIGEGGSDDESDTPAALNAIPDAVALASRPRDPRVAALHQLLDARVAVVTPKVGVGVVSEAVGQGSASRTGADNSSRQPAQGSSRRPAQRSSRTERGKS